ncbi:MAG: flagellar hook-length control protein FliK [Treponema sp.]|nr:flagellar hook-length control protein FliK [Treponema sp.]
MYISPYYEESATLQSLPQAPVSAAKVPEQPDSEKPNSGNMNVFSRILAGLLREAGAANAPAPKNGAADTSQLATDKKTHSTKKPDGDHLSGLAPNMHMAPVQHQQKPVHNGNVSPDLELKSIKIKESAGNDSKKAEKPVAKAKVSGKTPDAAMGVKPQEAKVPEQPIVLHPASEAQASGAVFIDAKKGTVQAVGEQNPQQKAGQEKIPVKGKTPNSDDAARLAFMGQTPPVRGDEVGVRKNGEAKKGRLEEVRDEARTGKERKTDRPVMEVRDLRTGQASASSGGNELRDGARVQAGPAHGNDAGTRDINMEMHLPAQSNSTPSSDTSWGTKAAFAYNDLIARELHDNFNSDIVRHASMVLRDEGKGLIRLALKPDTLGNVKIRLEMADNKITGHIIVESKEALQAFRKEIHSLEQSFRDSGFQDATLDMSLSADSRGAEQFQQWDQARPLLPEQYAAARYDVREQTEAPVMRTFEQGQTAINMLA